MSAAEVHLGRRKSPSGGRKFAAKRKAGVITNNPFYSTELVEQGSCGGVDTAIKSGTCYTYKRYDYGPWAVRGDASYTSDDYQAAVVAAARIAGTAAMAGIEEPEVSGLVELAELNMTAAMWKRLVPDFIGLVRKVRKTKHFQKSGMHIAEYIVKFYLGVRYGFTPFVGTVEALTNSISSPSSRPKRLTSRGYSSTGDYAPVIPDVVNVGTFTTTTTIETQKTSAEVRAGVLYEHRLAFDTYGLSVQQVPAAAWELLPWSFVVDWFWNCGDFIAAATPKAGVHILAQWTTIRSVKIGVKEYYTSPNSVSGWVITTGRKGSHTARRTVLDRRPVLYVGLSTKFHEIRFEKQKDFLHMADGLALVASLMSHPKTQSPKFRAQNQHYAETKQARRSIDVLSERDWYDLMKSKAGD